jgi:hypothetical protein
MDCSSVDVASCIVCGGEDSAAPATNFSLSDREELDAEPSMVLWGIVPEITVIESSNDVLSRDSSKGETSGLCIVSADAASAAVATSFSNLKGEGLHECRSKSILDWRFYIMK